MCLCTVILFLHCWWFWVLRYHRCIVGIFSTVISLLVDFTTVIPLLHCWWIWVLWYHSCWLWLLTYRFFYGYCSHHLEVNGVIRVQTTTSALVDKKTYSGTQDARVTRQDWQVLRSGWLRGSVLDCGRSTNSSSLAVTSPSLHSSLTTAAPAPSLPAPIERGLQSFTAFRQWFDILRTIKNSTSVHNSSLKGVSILQYSHCLKKCLSSKTIKSSELI